MSMPIQTYDVCTGSNIRSVLSEFGQTEATTGDTIKREVLQGFGADLDQLGADLRRMMGLKPPP
jgi:hypothetical protein